VFDLEIARPVPEKLGKPDWGAAKNCGISTLCAWLVHDISPYLWMLDSDRLPRVILTEQHATRILATADGFVSWNGVWFDSPVIKKSVPAIHELITAKPHVDLLALAACLHQGVKPDKLRNLTDEWPKLLPGGIDMAQRGWNLDLVGKATLGVGKTEGMGGAEAPIGWQRGRYSEVAIYCMGDVALTRLLYLHAWEEGWIKSPERGKVQIPRELL
jgi:predicted PolB exonuclease-like 3'-5' exonuclease